MGFYHNLAKCFLIFVNFFFTALGLFLIGIGAYMDHKYQNSDSMFSLAPEISFIPKTIVIIGIVVSIVYFLGFWGACREKQWMLKLYATILLIVLIFKVGVTLFMITDTSHYHEEVSRPLPYEDMFKQHDLNDRNEFFVDAIQLKFKCCGYLDPAVMKIDNSTYVSTCCGITDGVCPTPLYTEGCYYKIQAFFHSFVSAIKITYYSMFLVTAVNIAAGYGLASSISKKSIGPVTYKNFA